MWYGVSMIKGEVFRIYLMNQVDVVVQCEVFGGGYTNIWEYEVQPYWINWNAMVSFLFLILKPVLFLMLKKFFKKQMKAFIISAIEWLVLQTDNDLDDKILAKVKSGMKLGVVWSNAWQKGKWI